MDAVSFIREFGRMCEAHSDAKGCGESCPALHHCLVPRNECEYPEELVTAVEQWGKEHPLVTNGQKVMELVGYNGKAWTNDGDEGYVIVKIREDWWDAENKGAGVQRVSGSHRQGRAG